MKLLRNGYVLSVIGAVLLGATVSLLVFRGGGAKTTAGHPPPGGKVLQVSLRRGIYPTLGLVLEQPTSWLSDLRTGLLTLSSPDAGAAAVAISDPAPAHNDAKLRPEINSQLVRAFAPAKVIGRQHGPIGKTPAITTAIIGTSRAKLKVLILSTAVSSPYRTYSIQVVFKSLHPTRQSLLEVRSMLASIRFVAPSA